MTDRVGRQAVSFHHGRVGLKDIEERDENQSLVSFTHHAFLCLELRRAEHFKFDALDCFYAKALLRGEIKEALAYYEAEARRRTRTRRPVGFPNETGWQRQ